MPHDHAVDPGQLPPDPSSAPPLQWAVISPGGIAHQFTRSAHDATRSRVVAVASRAQERADAFANEHGIERAYSSVEQMLDEGGFDAVYIASPHAQHFDYAQQVLAAGVPMLIEKAFTLNAAQARQLLDQAQGQGSFVMEAMWTRFLPHIAALRSLITQGKVGELIQVVADHGQYFDPDPQHRLFNPELGGGALLDLGVYPISFAQMLLGDLQQVHASGSLTDLGVDANVAATAVGAGGATASVTTTLQARTPTTATVVGTEGYLHLQGPFYSPGPVQVHLHDRDPFTIDNPAHTELGMAYEIAEVARCLNEGRTQSPLMPWSDTVSVMTTMDTIRSQLGVRYPLETTASHSQESA